MRAITAYTMTKLEIERKFVLAANRNFRDISYCNAMMRDSIKGIAKSMFKYMEYYSGDPKMFRFSREDKTITANDSADRMLLIATTYFSRINRSVKTLNTSVDIKTVEWDMDNFIKKNVYGKPLRSRLKEQAYRAINEMEVYAALGLKNNNTPNEAMEVYFDDMDAPHRNVKIQELAYLGYLALKGSDMLRPKVGGMSSAYKSISRIMEDYMMRAYSEANIASWKGMYKYIITSSDPNVCSVCQDNGTRIFKADEFVVPTHNRCRCIEVPILVFTNDLEL